jgi:hypothetical protein
MMTIREDWSDVDATELSDWLAEAWSDYQSSWAVVDQELYDLCRRKNHDRLEDVYAKVSIINRVYMAGLARSIQGSEDLDAELTVGRLLLEHEHEVSSQVRSLQSIDDLTAETVGAIVEAHGTITRQLAPRLGGVKLSSFISKYLHFHCPMVPIYDSRAAEHIVEALGDDVPLGTRTDTLLLPPPTYDPNYYWYAGRFLKLWELARDATPSVTVKMLDHALWRGASV